MIDFCAGAVCPSFDADALRSVQTAARTVVVGFWTIVGGIIHTADGCWVVVNHEDKGAQALGWHAHRDVFHRCINAQIITLAKVRCLITCGENLGAAFHHEWQLGH